MGKWAAALLALATMVLPLAGCKNDSVPEPTKYTVTFDANGGAGSMDTQTFTDGVEQYLTANTFARDNYTFSGWSESKDATSATYTDKEKFTATENITLYAVWQDRWLTFTSADDTHLEVDPVGSGLEGILAAMEYSTDGIYWKVFENPQEDIPFGKGIELYLRGKSSAGTAMGNAHVNFGFKYGTKVAASGDIRTLVD